MVGAYFRRVLRDRERRAWDEDGWELQVEEAEEEVMARQSWQMSGESEYGCDWGWSCGVDD